MTVIFLLKEIKCSNGTVKYTNRPKIYMAYLINENPKIKKNSLNKELTGSSGYFA